MYWIGVDLEPPEKLESLYIGLFKIHITFFSDSKTLVLESKRGNESKKEILLLTFDQSLTFLLFLTCGFTFIVLFHTKLSASAITQNHPAWDFFIHPRRKKNQKTSDVCFTVVILIKKASHANYIFFHKQL